MNVVSLILVDQLAIREYLKKQRKAIKEQKRHKAKRQ
jgi:hypothetical protein